MFKFIEFRNFELFHSFLNQCPSVQYQEIVKYPMQEYKCEKEFINPIIVRKSESLPYTDQISTMHCSLKYVYLGSQKRIQVFDISHETRLLQILDIQNPLIIQEADDCLFVTQLEQILLLEISRGFAILGSYKLSQIQCPYSFLRVINQAQKPLDWYEIVIADLHSNSQKIKCNIYKLFNKRTVSFSTQEITCNGQVVELSQKERYSFETKTNILYELLVLENTSEQYAFVLYQMQNKISIIRINKTHKETPQLLYNLQNDDIDSGWACLGNCLDRDGKIKNAFSCSYGNVVHLFMYEILSGYLRVDEIGVKQLEGHSKINGLEFCHTDIFAVLVDEGFGLIHTTEFQKQENQLHYLNKDLKLRIFNGYHKLGLSESTLEFLSFLDCRTLLQNQADQLQFRKAMMNAVRVMNGELLLIKAVPSDQLFELLQKLAFTECLFLGKQNNLTINSLSEIVKFLISTKQEHYLFTIINDIILDLGYKDLFIKTIETLLQQHQIPYIPDQQLFELCKTYQSQKSYTMIRNLVCSLDFERISTAILVTCCEQMKMYEEMIYICQQSKDFVTPLVKLFGRDDINTECIKYIISILQGKSFQGRNLTDAEFTQAIRHLIQFLFVGENLYKILQNNPREALDIIYQFYIGKAQSCIEDSRAEIILKVQVDENNCTFFDFDETDVKSSVHRKMYLVLANQQFHQSQILLAYFSAKLLMHRFPLSSSVAFNTIQTLCRNYEFLLSLNSDQGLINQFIIRVMMAKSLTQEQLSDLEFSASIIKKFSLALVYIQSQQQQYKKAFETFKQVNEQLRSLMFPWLQSLIELRPMILNSQNDDFILEIVKYLLTVNEEETYKFIERNFHQKHFMILNCLQKDYQDGKYFVNFMSYLFQSTQKFLINDQTKILYLKHLCKTQPKQVLQTIKKMNFPLDEALKLTLEYKIMQAAAYIHEVSGATKQALDIYINSFLKKMKQNIVLLMKKQTLEEKSIDKLYLKQESIIRLVLEDYKQSNNDDSNLWMYYVDQYLKEHKIRTFVMANIPQTVKSLLSQFLSEYLARISDNVQVSNIFEQLNEKYPELPVNVFRQTIFRVVKNFNDDLRTLKETQIIQSNEKYLIIQQLKEINQSAWICNHICQRCKNHIIDSELVIAFTCSHVFHDYCVLKGYCKIPYCDTCENETSYKILRERTLKQYSQFNHIQETNFLQQMSVNKITLYTNQQQTQQDQIDKKSLLKKFDYQLMQKYDYSWA